ncbi:ATP-binding protein [Cellulosimicrobium sp. XJ-DQ-B-000]|uniref:ATP-binding protein n=1 Tax=Cellulosimicrobium sp. XJ-DQ-B-000 TaxID=3072182 RepID=UPI002808C8F7|nr:SbcC/MukB-like Walker B domain-containing protein [Cellulosimicrobium sp. XJ-DQ-B-000]MDQ8040864.1 ATP-binding protein [Cellulosimicrobium sp. XJ-DQ-B-000]
MTTDLLFSTQPGPVIDHDQWRIEALQMVNWGGFHGRREVRFSTGSTLLSGASGSGKSTVLDAYIALMMPSDTPFNGASNDAGGGRARSSEQRNLLSYLRGKMDESRVAGSHEMRDEVLRGRDGGPVWGAIAGTFVNDNGRRYTVARIYYAKAGARLGGEVVTTFATFDGYLDLTRLEALASTRFDKRSLKAAIPGLLTRTSFGEFESTIHTRLGIGDGGDGGRKAMRLLARVQAGMQISRVDGLYKKMVLEKPTTYQAADDALAHFADLEASYTKMVDEAAKVKTLERLPGLQHDLADAETKALLIAQFGADDAGPSPFQLWRLRTERRLLDTAVTHNRRDHSSTTTAFETAKTEEADLRARLAQIAKDKNAHGGAAIEERRTEIDRLTRSRETVYQANIRFQTRTEPINLVVPETSEQFAEAQADATEFLAVSDERETALRAEEETVREEELAPLTTRQRELLDERRSLQGRAGAVPQGLHDARVRMAQAAGLDPMEDLPFAAELIDVLPDEEHWRTAVETTLGGIARTVLVDRRTRNRLSSAIDRVSIRPRIRFQAVTLAEHEEWQGDPSYVSGKLAFKDSPFSHWLQDRVTAPGIDHLCVADAASLDGPGSRVTPAGQTRDGDKGAHGKSGDGSIIGFSNERRLADIETQLAELDPQIVAVRGRITAIQARLTDLRAQKAAHAFVQDTTWSEIDHLGINRRIAELEVEIRRLREANEILDALEAEEERLTPLHDKANSARVLAESRLTELDKTWGRLCDFQDTVQDAIDAIEDGQTVTVTDAQQTYLDTLFASNWDITNLDAFSSNIKALRRRLGDEAISAQRAVRTATNAMEGMFEAYQQQWRDPNLGVSVLSADGYREILDRIRSEGLHERRDTWKRQFAAWSSDDLLRLSETFDTALDDIEDRLRPINRILGTLPFGGKGVLQIDLRRLQSQELGEFRRDLRDLSSGLALELTEKELESRFARLREFMSRIAVTEGTTKASSKRDKYLDVRQHVVITAVVLGENGQEIAMHDSLGEKSGGETQELVAFIVGSALRYQLGDETRARPRFAPVFLDEGFVKADSEFAGRAVTAWQNLGFQLIIGAPFDKVTGLEPHMDLVLEVTKSAKGYSFVHELVDDEGEV